MARVRGRAGEESEAEAEAAAAGAAKVQAEAEVEARGRRGRGKAKPKSRRLPTSFSVRPVSSTRSFTLCCTFLGRYWSSVPRQFATAAAGKLTTSGRSEYFVWPQVRPCAMTEAHWRLPRAPCVPLVRSVCAVCALCLACAFSVQLVHSMPVQNALSLPCALRLKLGRPVCTIPVLHAGKKKTSAEDMARHARLLLKTEALLRTVGHGPSPLPAAVPRARPALRAAGASVDLRHPLPSALSPLESELHSRLRSTLSGPLYMGCRPSELPNITVYSTAYHSTGILHATAHYFGEGAWHDGIDPGGPVEAPVV